MQGLWNVAAGIAVLGIGFGVGNWQAARTDQGVSDETGELEAITFLGKGDSAKGSGRIDPATGAFPYATFEEAAPRLKQGIADYLGLSVYERVASPIHGERILQEIERILALATPAQLAGTIKDLESHDNAAPLFEIAFAALARHSPSVAAQTGLGIWPGDAEAFPGLDALMREWERRDSAGAERWIGGLEDGNLKKASLLIFLTRKAETDPALAVSRLDEIDPESGSGLTFASVLANALDPARCPEVAERMLGRQREGSPSAGMIAGFLASWGAREPGAMMEWLLSQDLESFGRDDLRSALYSMVASDPKGFLQTVSPTLAAQPALREAAGQAWWAWIATDGEEADAIGWLRENSASATEFGDWRIADQFANPDDWTPQRTQRVLDALKTLPPGDSLAAFSQGFLERLSRHQAKLVLDFAVEFLPLGSRSDQTIAHAVGNWASTEPEAALRWSLENLELPSARNGAVRFAISRWAEKDPLAAAGMAMTLPEKERGHALGGLAYQWAEKDPQGLLSFLKSALDPAVVSSLTQSSFRQLSERRRGAQYLQEALAMPPGKMRHDAVSGLFSGWALSDTTGGAAAMEKIPEGTLRDAAIRGFNGFAIRSDPKLAMELATRISIPDARDKELVSRGRYWLKQDRKTAEAAIRANSAIPESVKAEIFK